MLTRKFFVLCFFIFTAQAVHRCGSAFNNAFCDEGQGCCSDQGYCGFGDDYCLVASGCQRNCTDGIPTHTAVPSSTTSLAASSSSAAAAAASKPPLSKGVIIGIVVGGLFVILCIAAGILYSCSRHNKNKMTHEFEMQNLKHNHEETMIVHKKQSQLLAIGEANPAFATQMLGQLGNIQRGEGSGSARRGLAAPPTRVYEEE